MYNRNMISLCYAQRKYDFVVYNITKIFFCYALGEDLIGKTRFCCMCCTTKSCFHKKGILKIKKKIKTHMDGENSNYGDKNRKIVPV